MQKNSFALRGVLVDALPNRELRCIPGGYAVCEDGVCAGAFGELPERYRGLPVEDLGDRLVMPGLCDLHLHAPQYAFRGMGMDLELLPWLSAYTFPEEEKYADRDYARRAYEKFAEDLKNSATTRAVIFGTVHRDSDVLLMELLDRTGVQTMAGKVNMDRNSPPGLTEDTDRSLGETEDWILETRERFRNTRPILTPRFVPTCSDRLLEGLGKLAERYGLPVQSHLSENRSEIAWVRELCPWSSCYGDVYRRFGLFGGAAPAVMAHCVYSPEEEMRLMAENGVFAAHCPESNMNLASGMAPVRRLLELGVPVGLGTDVAGGSSLSLFRAAAQAVQVSKLRRAVLREEEKPLTAAEAFFLATRGGGAFWGKVGAFEEGFEFDAVAADDESFGDHRDLSPAQRLERVLYLAQSDTIVEKYARGRRVK